MNGFPEHLSSDLSIPEERYDLLKLNKYIFKHLNTLNNKIKCFCDIFESIEFDEEEKILIEPYLQSIQEQMPNLYKEYNILEQILKKY